MNFLDIGIFTVLFYNIVSGLKKGLIRSIFEIIALIGGIILAINYYTNLAVFFVETLKFDAVGATILSFILIWCFAFILITLLGQFIHQFLTFSILNWVNYLFGGILGLLKGFFVLIPFIIPMFYFDFPPVSKSYFLTTTAPIFYFIMDNWAPKALFEQDLIETGTQFSKKMQEEMPSEEEIQTQKENINQLIKISKTKKR